ncbi:MAG: hypothetical protein VXW87_02055 [Pseudomonadota bacterium]|nr:hypothetical protein [Pseudomonadota bacterium]
MKTRLNKTISFLSVLALFVSQAAMAETMSSYDRISRFFSELKIAGDTYVIKVPSKMYLVEETEEASKHENTLVFQSKTTPDNHVIYHQEWGNPSFTEYTETLEAQLRQTYSHVRVTGKSMKRLRGKHGTVEVESITFAFKKEGRPTAVSITSFTDNLNCVLITGSAQKSTLKKAIKVAQGYSRNALIRTTKNPDSFLAGIVKKNVGNAITMTLGSTFYPPLLFGLFRL